MKNIAIINGIGLSEYAFKKLTGDKNSIELVMDYARGLPDVDKVVLLSGGTPPGEYPAECIPSKEWDTRKLLDTIARSAGGYDNIFYLYGDTPFLDVALAETMYGNHKSYFAEYTFADGYPLGLAPEIIGTRCLGRLVKLLGEERPEIRRDSIFEIIKKDINSFDIETEISPKDLRMLRVELFADKKRNFMLLERICGKEAGKSGEILKVLDDFPEILRTLPAFYSVQIAADCPQECSYCPYPGMDKSGFKGKKEMNLTEWKGILEGIRKLSGEAVVSISLWGDPACHSNIEGIIEAMDEYPELELVIETAGIGWPAGLPEKIKKFTSASLTWIVSLDAREEAVYEQLRGQGYGEAVATAEKLLELFPGRCYIQAVRMQSNEDDLEKFYDYWKRKTENLIIQKHDHFCDILEELKVTDLSPVNRFPCWHIKRDVNILLDGRVMLCREDVNGKHVLGNIFTESPDKIWGRGETYYMEQLKENYNSLCKRCDEYYTYNF